MSEYIVITKNFLNRIGERLSEEDLIRFDYKSLLLILLSIILFSTFVLFKIHGSSVACWNDIVSNGSQPGASLENQRTGLLFGEPQGVRADEWSVQTPFILSQFNHKPKFPVENPTIGAGKTSLVMSYPTPVKHYSNIFRPQGWGFFVLDAESGFSFYWNFKVFALFLSFFFLLMLISNSDFWVSLFGSLWLFFSMYIQWWFSILLPELIASFSIMFVASAYLILSRKKLWIILSSSLLVLSGIGFVLLLYPPFQIQLFYLWLFLSAGFMLAKFNPQVFRANLGLRLSSAFIASVVSIVVLYFFYQETKDTISIIMHTAYPGSRVVVSGGLPILRVFSGYFDIFLRHGTIPKTESNICEASNFVLLTPLVLLGIILGFSRHGKRGIDMFQVPLFAYLFVLLSWMIVRMPDLFGQLTLLNRIPIGRCHLGIGVASIISSVRFLSVKEPPLDNKRLNYGIAFGVFALFLVYGLAYRDVTLGFFRIRQVVLLSGFMTLAAYLFLNKKRLYFSSIFLVFVLTATIAVNPISTGLNPIYEKNLTKFAMRINGTDSQAKWVVYGDRMFANFLEASGVNVFNGVKYAPDFKSFKVLDPKSEYVDFYNRYAHIVFQEPDPKSNQEIAFELASGDCFIVRINPCSNRLKQLGIKYVVFTYKPDPKLVAGMAPATQNPVGNAWVYKLN